MHIKTAKAFTLCRNVETHGSLLYWQTLAFSKNCVSSWRTYKRYWHQYLQFCMS